MMRMPSAKEQEEEAKAQDFMFKLNLVLFVGSIIAINVGKWFKDVLFISILCCNWFCFV